jgi:hypothetical protein
MNCLSINNNLQSKHEISENRFHDEMNIFVEYVLLIRVLFEELFS